MPGPESLIRFIHLKLLDGSIDRGYVSAKMNYPVASGEASKNIEES
jgi:hypothetical protein